MVARCALVSAVLFALTASAKTLSSTKLGHRDVFSESQDLNDEGEAHGDIDPPKGSEFSSIPATKNGDEEVAVFRSKDVDCEDIEHAYVIIHGRLRNGDDYWEYMDDAIDAARQAGVPGANRTSIVVSPQFFSTKYNSGQYEKNQLAWDDLNDWQDGGVANHPSGTDLTSMDALDAIVDEYSNHTKYPSMRNVTIVGHGGGGQLAQRYAAIAVEPSSHIHVRYIHGDPSSNVYFTDDRPTMTDTDLPSKDDCEFYNTWRYGFDDFPAQLGARNSVEVFFKQYISRDVISLVGYHDTEDSGDQSCMARVQGGDKRRDRNLIWYQYINLLAGTEENVDNFPGTFDPSLPDWSDLSDNESKLRLVVVEDATHDVEKLFASSYGRSALFSDGDVEVGWRPE